jgi:hypothetical protein
MGLLDDSARDTTPPETADADADDTPTPPPRRKQGGTTASIKRGTTVDVAGETVEIDPPETNQSDEKSGNWLTGDNLYGIPRGHEAVRARNIVQTSAMQSIVNGIVDQLLGGDLAFLDDEDVMEDLSDSEVEAAGELKTVLRDVLTGPHMGDEDLDDLVTACVEDMLGPGNAYLQLLEPSTADLPVVSLTTLDPLTVRHNYAENGFPKDPPYFQARRAFAGGSVSSLNSSKPTPLTEDQLAVLRYPKGNRSYKRYPISAAMQIEEWLELLADSTTHHKRYYSDSEATPGILQIIEASDSTVKEVENQVEQAAGDPRDFPIIGGESAANWIEMGGTGINLDLISEQKWFFQMCLGALGLNKAEVGMVEDVNYSNGEVQSEIVFKRVAGPFGKQFEQAFLHVARQFDAFRELGEPFTPTLAYTDPRAERAKQERLREEYDAGKLTLRQYIRRAGDEDMADDPDRYTVSIGGETVDYGDHPKWVAQKLINAAAGESSADVDGDGGDGDDGNEAFGGED